MSLTKKTIWRSDEMAAQDLATGAGAMSVTFDPEGSCKVLQVNLHLNETSATSENLVISLDSDNGTEYDVNLVTKDMNTIKDLILTDYDIGRFYMFGADKMTFAWNNNNARTWGLEIIYQKFRK